ncbi:hypothetical protein [Persicirhabdus sediminis]|uniref:Uncharacterized protein n=1 Tax=Persicirhabdus sediminis TaxID=454144 RepID=A0A8J7MGU5_9BACT|nr:hypothetical protein [Persicirhabdus sediminis]MBK1792601.1 hypothetical protein [Persicirhabdus sediminis]
MSKKKGDNTIFLPGAEGWQLWQGNRDDGYSLAVEQGPLKAAEFNEFIKGEMVMGFPLKSALAVPFTTQTNDSDLFADLASMHLETAGVRVADGAGQLSDLFEVRKDDDSAALLPVVLSPPEDDEMPLQSAKAYDLSARFFQLPDDAVVLWRELGRWVFACSVGNKLAYFQSLPFRDLGPDTSREVSLAVMQLQLQGLQLDAKQLVIWASEQDGEIDVDVANALESALRLPLQIDSKPDPQLPRVLSELLPENARAEQLAQAEAKKRKIFIAAFALVYLMAIGYLLFNYWQINTEFEKASIAHEEIAPIHTALMEHNAQWDELALVVRTDLWPMNLLKEAAPKGSLAGKVRFTKFDVNSGTVTIQGEAESALQVDQYRSQLKRSLRDYDWVGATPSADKNGRWKFTSAGENTTFISQP